MNKTIKAIKHEFKHANGGDWIMYIGLGILIPTAIFLGTQAVLGKESSSNQVSETIVSYPTLTMDR